MVWRNCHALCIKFILNKGGGVIKPNFLYHLIFGVKHDKLYIILLHMYISGMTLFEDDHDILT
jgi:hypothetical protein